MNRSITCVASLLFAAVSLADTARGVVYEDTNRDGVRQSSERGLEGVRVSNGRDVVLTDDTGRYEIEAIENEAIFVIKPSGYAVPLDELNKPQFYYTHSPKGSPRGLRYAGVEPTGPLPESIDFALHSSQEPDRFSVILLGDPQPRNITELENFAHDVIADVRATEFAGDAAFVFSLGDIMFDTLSLFGPYDEYMSLLDKPVHNVHGNHDMNFDVPDDTHADATWNRLYGPATYAFDYGEAHFIVLDNVVYEGDKDYHADLNDDQLAFIRNSLEHVSTDRLVVLAMHIPLPSVRRKAELFEILAPYEHTFSMGAHWHRQIHFFMDSEDGWTGAEPHHHLVHATGCGSWWAGALDERGIPHATMSDGQPNGWSLLTIDGNEYTIRFKAAGEPPNQQMAVHFPSVLQAADVQATNLVVNAWASNPRSTVEFRVDDGEWTPMTHTPQRDPGYLSLKLLEEQFPGQPGRAGPRARQSQSTWQAPLPRGLQAGPHMVEVRHTDMFGQVWTGRRPLRVR